MENGKILIRAVNWVGDAVMTLPTVEAIKKGSHNCPITMLVNPSVSAIYEGSPFVDKIFSYGKRERGLAGRLALSWRLLREGFTKAYLLQNAFDAALTAFLAGVPERIGYDRDARGWLLTSRVPYNGEDRRIHHIDYFLNIAAFEGIKPVSKNPYIYLSLEERIKARQYISLLKRPILGINPGAAYGEAKRWMPERFVEVANWFISNTDGSVVLFSKDALDMVIYNIEKKITGNKLSLAGKTTLRELIALIAECDLFLTNDSGPMHIARAVMTPSVSIFGSTDPALTGYEGGGFRSIKSNVSCSPCFKRKCPQGDLICLSNISPDEVFFELMKLLPKKRAVFFDRDGTICHDANYLNKWEDLQVYPEISEIARLKEKGYLLIGITNQSGIARGIVKEGFVKEVNNLFIEKYGFDDFLYCTHHPDEHCSCRKPEPGMLLSARIKYGIDLKGSFFVGDKPSDMFAAEAVGARGILIGSEGAERNAIAANLKEAVRAILSSE